MRKVIHFCLLAFLSVFWLESRFSVGMGKYVKKIGGALGSSSDGKSKREIERLVRPADGWSESISRLQSHAETYLQLCASGHDDTPQQLKELSFLKELRMLFEKNRGKRAPDELKKAVWNVWKIMTELDTDQPKHKDVVLACIGQFAYVTRAGDPRLLYDAAGDMRTELHSFKQRDTANNIEDQRLQNVLTLLFDRIFPTE